MQKTIKIISFIFFTQCLMCQANANPPVPTTKINTSPTVQIQQKTTQTKPTASTTHSAQQVAFPKISVPQREDLKINTPIYNTTSASSQKIAPTNTKQIYTSQDIFVINNTDDDEVDISNNQTQQKQATNYKIKTIEKKEEKVITEISKTESTANTTNKENHSKQNTEQPTSKATITPDKADYYAQVRDNARVLYNSGEILKAKEEFSKIPDEEKISDDWLFLGNIALDENKAIDSVFYYKKAIQADENNYKAHFNLGNLYFADNKINMALNEYRQVLKINKNYAYAHYNKGCCYLKNDSLINARYEFGLAIRSNPHEPAFYYNLAYTNKLMGKTKKAQDAIDMYNQLMNQ